jgi:signal transduction histidine kinase
MGSLRQKLAFGYGLMIIIILAVSAWSIYHFVRLGSAVDIILVNNYKSIRAAELMKDALERQDSASLFFISGKADKARQQYNENAELFSQEFNAAADNITESGEDRIISEIETNYTRYKQDIEILLNSTTNKNLSVRPDQFYFSNLEPEFLAAKASIDEMLTLNQQAMLAANERALSQAERAEASTIMLAACGLVLALVFAWRFISYVVDPVTSLAEKARQIGEGDFDQHISIQSHDEIGQLASEFNRMAARLRDLRKSDNWRLLIERKKSDAVIDALFEPVIVTDARGEVTKINDAARHLFVPAELGEALTSDINLAKFEAGEKILQAVRDAVAMQKPIAAEGQAALVPIQVGRASRSYRLRTTPMRDEDGRLLGAVTLLEDVTAMKEVDKIKDEFISVASDRLREPIRNLQLALHALVEEHLGELSDDQKSMLSDARDNVEHLDDIMSDLLELAEIESGARHLSIERLRPVEVARAAVERFQSAAESKHVDLQSKVWPDLPWILADRSALKRIFNNLLSNAIRHTKRGGQVAIEAIEHADRVFFSVRDTGEGIPEDHLPTIFGRFVHAGGKQAGRTGLGLALVKRLVEVQGGQVSVESRAGEGTNFTIALPVGGPSNLTKI